MFGLWRILSFCICLFVLLDIMKHSVQKKNVPCFFSNQIIFRIQIMSAYEKFDSLFASNFAHQAQRKIPWWNHDLFSEKGSRAYQKPNFVLTPSLPRSDTPHIHIWLTFADLFDRKCNFPMTPFARLSRRLVGLIFLKGRKVNLPCTNGFRHVISLKEIART